MANFTKQAIIKAFTELLKKKSLDKITVKDIVEKCGVNRNTFYYHFVDIQRLTEEMLMAQADTIISKYPDVNSLYDALSVTVHFAKENKQVVLNIHNSKQRFAYEKSLMKICEYIVEKYMQVAFPKIDISNDDKRILVTYYKSTVYGIIVYWVDNGMKESALDDFKRLEELRKGMAKEMLERAQESKKTTKK